jgi:hypothetical protein
LAKRFYLIVQATNLFGRLVNKRQTLTALGLQLLLMAVKWQARKPRMK